VLRTRGIHPFNPQGFWSGPWGLSLNTASSFVSNTTGPTHLGQTIAMAPVGSQEAIKLLSGNGGGFFNTNSAHPFENPTGLASVVEALLMLLIPAAMTNTFGRMVGRTRQGRALYSAMLVLFVAGVGVLYAAETHGTPAMHAAGLHGANLQDKEQRFGTAGSALFVAAGTASGAGAVNSGVEAFTGLGSAVATSNIMTGEVIFGGPGSGLFGMLLLVVLAVSRSTPTSPRPTATGRRWPATPASYSRTQATSARAESPSRTSPAAW
jgi:potassium-transporting ATPase potassium-binding subunit